MKAYCKECNNYQCDIDGCAQFGHKFAGVKSLLYHMRAYRSGVTKARTKTKELSIHQALQKSGLEFEYQKYIPFAGCGLNSETRCAYIDFLFVKTWGYIILEIDEDQHKSYTPSCDVRRDFDIVASVSLGSAQKLTIIHYNPDAFQIGERTTSVSTKDRIDALVTLIQDMPEPQGFERIFMYYTKDAADSALPAVAKNWDDLIAKQVSRCI